MGKRLTNKLDGTLEEQHQALMALISEADSYRQNKGKNKTDKDAEDPSKGY